MSDREDGLGFRKSFFPWSDRETEFHVHLWALFPRPDLTLAIVAPHEAGFAVFTFPSLDKYFIFDSSPHLSSANCPVLERHPKFGLVVIEPGSTSPDERNRTRGPRDFPPYAHLTLKRAFAEQAHLVVVLGRDETFTSFLFHRLVVQIASNQSLGAPVSGALRAPSCFFT